jgi:hypothetical protein
MSSPSEIKRVEGGGWSKAHRFFDPTTKSDTPGPGAPYHLPSLFSEHAQGPIYRQEFESPRALAPDGAPAAALPHPSKDRTAWMIGTTKNDLAYYSNIAGNMGPAFYNPSIAQTTQASPRNVFSKNRRFMSLTHRYISKEHNMANLCTASPGPKYAPKQCHLDLTSRFPPEYSFGGRGLSDRGQFVHGAISKTGYMYTARPATSDPNTNVGPAQYVVKAQITEMASPRPIWSKADRFAPMDSLFISKRHVRSKLGLNSPGPKYAPTNYDISANLRQSGKPANIPSGKWCP